MNVGDSDETHARELAERLRENRQPRCPQFRLAQIERVYPVQGCRVLTQSPGWFMIPSIEEYWGHCTTPRFSECCWFRRKGCNADSVDRERGEPCMCKDVWGPADT